MIFCALALAAMIVFGLAGRAELKIDRAKLRMVAVWSVVARRLCVVRSKDVFAMECSRLGGA